jgi:predicted CxxxxCH...CXXCH cytochrome family protein
MFVRLAWGVTIGLVLASGAPGCDGSSSTPPSVEDGALDAADAGNRDINSVAEQGSGDSSGDSSADAGVTSCAAGCHGSAGEPAPPLALNGRQETSVSGVGAHAQHLASSSWHVQLQCDDCHLVPTEVTDPGHIDTTLPAELTFSAFAKTDGASPAWSGTSCSGVYCHGVTLSGGSDTSPVWTKVDGSQTQCGSCHGMPPTGDHTTSTACAACHGAVVDAAQTIIAPSLHIDGKVTATSGIHSTGFALANVHGPVFYQDPQACTVCHGVDLKGGSAQNCGDCHSDWQTSCTFCHGGTDNTTGAPPSGVGGQSSTTVAGVGRHTSHVTAGATHGAYACELCHKVPTEALSPGHIDPAPAEVVFTGLATGASYNPATYWCTNVYCHGDGKTGSSGSALWIGSLSGGCASCHDDESGGGSMTLGGRHEKHIVDKNLGCSDCHGCVVNSSKQIIDQSKHLNGQMDICLPSWNPTNRSCSPPACHGSESWGGN